MLRSKNLIWTTETKIKDLLPTLREIVNGKTLSESDSDSDRYRVDIQKIIDQYKHQWHVVNAVNILTKQEINEDITDFSGKTIYDYSKMSRNLLIKKIIETSNFNN